MRTKTKDFRGFTNHEAWCMANQEEPKLGFCYRCGNGLSKKVYEVLHCLTCGKGYYTHEVYCKNSKWWKFWEVHDNYLT